tara:strand:+ start:558 stop:1106 length:549 start_codon:yes stop_codon:yes gene_type:complete
MSNTKHEIVFKYSNLSSKLNLSKSTLTRAMKMVDIVNTDKKYIELNKIGNNEYFLKFFPNGKTEPKNINSMDLILLDFLKQYYIENDIHYPELKKHKSHIKKISTKLSLVLTSKKVEINDENLINTFKVFFKNIPLWWKQNQFTLPSINKNFTKILNQIKSKNNKSIKYDNTNNQVDNLKFK